MLNLLAINILLLVFISKFCLAQTVITNYGINYPFTHFINIPPIKYVEDYYELYSRRLYYEDHLNVRQNIVFCQWALKAEFRPEHKALCPIYTIAQRDKYRLLLKMHLNILILKDFLYLGRIHDMPEIYFWHCKEQLIDSLTKAKAYYQKALEYWPEVFRLARAALKIKERIELEYFEDQAFLIVNRDVDWQFDRIIKEHINRVEKNLALLKQ